MCCFPCHKSHFRNAPNLDWDLTCGQLLQISSIRFSLRIAIQESDLICWHISSAFHWNQIPLISFWFWKLLESGNGQIELSWEAHQRFHICSRYSAKAFSVFVKLTQNINNCDGAMLSTSASQRWSSLWSWYCWVDGPASPPSSEVMTRHLSGYLPTNQSTRPTNRKVQKYLLQQ